MGATMKKIAVVQGAPSATVQAMFRELVARWQPSSRIVGVVEEDHGLPNRKCHAGYLRSIISGLPYPIFQDLGPGADACHLDGSGALSATEAVQKDIAAGCDLVILSKFGKLEAAREGLVPAFVAAMEAELPVLTSVSPAFEQAWALFAEPMFVVLPAEVERVDAWWRNIENSASR